MYSISGYAIFFEFKHYKPKKGSVSTRCWAFMESDEIKDGSTVLELYVYTVLLYLMLFSYTKCCSFVLNDILLY